MDRAHLPEDSQPRPRSCRWLTQAKLAGTSGFFVQLDELYKTVSMASSYVYYKWRKLARSDQPKSNWKHFNRKCKMAQIHFKIFLIFSLITFSQCRINSEPREREGPSSIGGIQNATSDHPSAAGDHNASSCDGFGWTLNKGKCYKVIEGLMDWNHMIAACKSEGAILVCIQSEDENRFVGKMIAKPIERSLDNYRLETTLFNTFWIGLNRVKNGEKYDSTWVNGKKAMFGNLPEITTELTTANGKNKYPWGEGEPSGTNKFTDPTGVKEECVHMFSADGSWNDAECRVQMSGGVCQKVPKY
ncbi:hypothetical protein niasHT_020991 [Heterodera trifolii]|uniref:C-type lectin domain-containing protein n=1 Tax=Heterodera trifolii TaxID=157864 RepID=A0ABD2KCR6_9BILA